jgi:hypothetical protein
VLSVTSGQVIEVLVFGALLGWAWYVGGSLLAALEGGDSLLTSWPRAAVEAAMGLAALSYAVLAVALLDLLGGASLIGVLILGPLAASALRLRLRTPIWQSEAPPGNTDSQRDFVEYIAIAFISVTLAVTFGGSLAPQTAFDALHYHFAMPRILLSEGGFVERPDIIQSYFPLGMEVAYLPAYRFGGETTMTLLNWATTPMTAALLWGVGNRFFGRPSGSLAAAALCFAPLVIWESVTASSDLAMTFWLIASATAIAAYAARPRAGTALLAGLFAGLAVSFKIVSGIYVIPLALGFAALLILVTPAGSRATQGLAFAGGGLMAGAPWLLLRWVQTGNPVFPLYNNIFKSDKWAHIHERFDLAFFGIGHELSDFVAVWWEVAAHPWRFGQWHPPWAIGIPVLVFGAALLTLPRLTANRSNAALMSLALLAAIFWFALSQYHRYGLPAFALMALLGGAGLWLALRQLPKPWPAIAATALLTTWFLAGSALGLVTFHPDYPADVVLGRESRESYQRRSIANYEALRFLDGAMRDGEEAGTTGYPFNYFVLYPLHDLRDPGPPSTRFRELAGLAPSEMAQRLLDERIRWLLVDHNRANQEGQPEWLREGVLSAHFLDSQTEVAFERGGAVVYRILDPQRDP